MRWFPTCPRTVTPLVRAAVPLVLACVLAVTWGALRPSPTRACLRVPEPVFELDPSLQEVDHEPPAGFSEVTASVFRSASGICGPETCTMVSCAGTGQVSFHIEHPNLVSGEALGVKVITVEGSLPRSMEPSLLPLRPLTPELVILGDFEEITELDAVVQLVAVDRAGNQSTMSEPIRVRWSGCTTAHPLDGCVDETRYHCTSDRCVQQPAGCSVGALAGTHGATLPGSAAVPGLLLWFRRRGRRRAGAKSN